MSIVEQLSPRQGKVLRIVVMTDVQPVPLSRCIHTMPWSDLPKTVIQAHKALEALHRLNLVERVGKRQYIATQAGIDVIAYANKEKLWRQPPPPEVTNKFRYRKEDQQ